MRITHSLLVILFIGLAGPVTAQVKTPAVIGSNMVLQQQQTNPIWGWADPGESVTVTFAGQTHTTVADKAGEWRVVLDPLPANSKPQTMVVKGSNTLTFENVLVGEVWICSGQSNMSFSLKGATESDLEIPVAKYPQIRLITVPHKGTQEMQKTFWGKWQACTPKTAMYFSAVGYFFGRQLHQTLDVPIGLIDNAWGGSACEAWIRRDLLEADPNYKPLLDYWVKSVASYDAEKAKAVFDEALAKWKVAIVAAKEKGTAPPRRKPRLRRDPAKSNNRPGNLYAGVLAPTIGYGIRGVIWYQGEANAGRAYQYRHMFPMMIKNWRQDWKQKDDFSFYWVQLADYKDERDEPTWSAWAELREAQTMTLSKLPRTGQAVIIDLGEGRDIHPRDKRGVAMRLARWALAKDYGVKIAHQSPTYKSMEVKDGKAILRFDHVGRGLYAFDTKAPVGFAIAGEDQKFVWAQAAISGTDRVEVWSDQVKAPVAVRYAWANNPVCNLQSREGLPTTPFRTDDWSAVTRKRVHP